MADRRVKVRQDESACVNSQGAVRDEIRQCFCNKKKEKGGRKYCVSDFRQNVGRIRIGVIHATQGLQDTRTRKRDASRSARRSQKMRGERIIFNTKINKFSQIPNVSLKEKETARNILTSHLQSKRIRQRVDARFDKASVDVASQVASRDAVGKRGRD